MIADDSAPDMTHKAQINQQAQEVLAYLEHLGEDKKELFVMRIWQDMSREEIESATGKSNAALRKEYSRLIQKLVEKFGYMAVLCVLFHPWIR